MHKTLEKILEEFEREFNNLLTVDGAGDLWNRKIESVDEAEQIARIQMFTQDFLIKSLKEYALSCVPIENSDWDEFGIGYDKCRQEILKNIQND